MVRNRQRTTDKAKWSAETLKSAIQMIKSGSSVKSVSKKFQIPRSTLRDRIKTEIFTKSSLGRKPIFNENQEKLLSDCVLSLAESFYGITLTDLRRVAFDVAEKLGLHHNFNRETKMAGEEWVAGFRRRNSFVCLKKVQATIVGFNKNEVDLFYNNLETVINKDYFDASKIYNMDEMGISLGETLGPKQVGAVTNCESGQNMTVICSFSASGNYIPPLFIYPTKCRSPLLETEPFYKYSHNGCINNDIFLEWLIHFKNITKPTKKEPVLLFLDNHASHVSFHSYEFCRENLIHVVSIPPHTSHELQPLDLTFFGPLKSTFNKEYDVFLKNNVDDKMTPCDITGIFNKAYTKVATIEKAVAGFHKAGIYPFQPIKRDEYGFISNDEVPRTVIVQEKDEDTNDESFVPPSQLNNFATHFLLQEPVPSSSVGPFKDEHFVCTSDLKDVLKDVTLVPLFRGSVKEKERKRKLNESGKSRIVPAKTRKH